MKNKTKGLIIGALGPIASMALASWFEKKNDSDMFDDETVDVPCEEIPTEEDGVIEEVKEG